MATAVIGILTGGLLLSRFAALRGTTLVAPWCWALAAVAAVAGCELLLVQPALAGWGQPLRLVAVTSMFCPGMALLGAKRPQDRAWFFVVLSLWVVLALPAVEHVFLRRAERSLDIHYARQWFFLVLLGVELVALLPTRFGLAALLAAAGQAVLVSRYLPVALPVSQPVPWGLGLMLLAVVSAMLTARRGTQATEPLNRVWLDFRDMFGWLWALRVAEHLNAAARANGWDVRVDWAGFHHAVASGPFRQASLPAEVLAGVRQSFENQLRRFVSPTWIADRREIARLEGRAQDAE